MSTPSVCSVRSTWSSVGTQPYTKPSSPRRMISRAGRTCLELSTSPTSTGDWSLGRPTRSGYGKPKETSKWKNCVNATELVISNLNKAFLTSLSFPHSSIDVLILSYSSKDTRLELYF